MPTKLKLNFNIAQGNALKDLRGRIEEDRQVRVTQATFYEDLYNTNGNGKSQLYGRFSDLERGAGSLNSRNMDKLMDLYDVESFVFLGRHNEIMAMSHTAALFRCLNVLAKGIRDGHLGEKELKKAERLIKKINNK